MKDTALVKLEEQLFAEEDGNKFSKLKDKLLKHKDSNKPEVLEILTKYVEQGRIIHWRNFLLTDIIGLIEEGEKQYASFFQRSIRIPELAYWSIDGLLKVDEKESYEILIGLIKTESMLLNVRAKAIKSISIASKQTFDRNLVSDPGYWKEEDLRIEEILAWQENNYPDGKGHLAPETHACLENPVSKLDKLAVRLEKKLLKKRNKRQDLSNPTNWLVVADENDMTAIEQKWELPSNYVTFLKNYSPINVNIYSKTFPQGLDLYHAGNVIKRQAGYAYNGSTMEETADWPSNFVVIADASGDPYCIAMDEVTDGDAPVYTSMHGASEWKFERYADSFIDFLKEIIKHV